MRIDPAHRDEIISLARELSVQGSAPDRVERLATLVGMEPEQIDEARQAGLCSGSGEGQIETSVIVLMLPRAQVETLLPLGLALAPNPVSPVGQHPVFVQLSRYSFDYFGGMHYHETMIGVPYVQLSVWRAPRRGPFIYMPRLYLDERLPQLLGVYLYGYEKQLATIDQSPPTDDRAGHYRVFEHETSTPLITAAITPEGPAKPMSSSFETLRQLFEMPTISQAARIWDPDAFTSDTLSPYLASNIVYHLDRPDTTIQPVSIELSLHDDVTPPGIPPGTYRSGSLKHTPLGSFRLSTRVGVALPSSPATLRYPRPAPARKQRVLVLGGGPAACAAAYWMAKQPERYEVQMYTLGWRLGGKCAAGRNPKANMRIEEHGLHAFLGFYENAIRTVRDVWATANIPIATPQSPIGGALLGSKFNGLMIERDGQWKYYETPLPTNDRVPGFVPPEARDDDAAQTVVSAGQLEPPATQGLGHAMVRTCERMVSLVARVTARGDEASGALCDSCAEHLRGGVLAGLRERLRERSDDLVEGRLEELLRGFIRYLQNVADLEFEGWLAEGPDGPLGHLLRPARTARRIIDRIVDRFGDNDDVWYLWMNMDTMLTVIIGIIEDRVVHLSQIDHRDTWEWLKIHGLDDRLLPEELRSAPVTGGQPEGSPAVAAVYETLFAHGPREPRPRQMAAGVGIRWLLMTGFGYAGHPAYLFKYSCPQTILTPYYRALTESLGARVHFFHKVTDLEIEGSGDSKRLVKVKLERQATVRDGSAAYRPFIDNPPPDNPADLPPWPVHPNYDQLVEGEALREQGIDLESPWTPWTGVGEVELVQGRDFDVCIVGISLAALPPLTRSLWDPLSSAYDRRWATMFSDMAVTRTISMQLWIDAPERELYDDQRGLLTEYVLPEPSFGNFTHLTDWEGWGDDPPKFVAYHTGSLVAQSVFDHPPFSQHGYPEQINARWVDDARRWMKRNYAAFYDQAPAEWADFEALLRVPTGMTPSTDRFSLQYFNSGVNLSDRYVLSQPEGMPARMGQMESGVQHMFLCGDWTRTDLNCGCVEAATQSGMLCAQGLSQHPVYVWRSEF